MVTSVYAPRTVALWVGGRRIGAEAFVVAREHAQYAGRPDDAPAARIIHRGIGRITTTREDATKAVSNSIMGSALLAGCLVLSSAPAHGSGSCRDRVWPN